MLTWGGPSTRVLKVIKLIVPFCVVERSVQRGARSGVNAVIHAWRHKWAATRRAGSLFRLPSRIQLFLFRHLMEITACYSEGCTIAGTQSSLHCCWSVLIKALTLFSVYWLQISTLKSQLVFLDCVDIPLVVCILVAFKKYIASISFFLKIMMAWGRKHFYSCYLWAVFSCIENWKATTLLEFHVASAKTWWCRQ